jgi:hypothetical protein
VTFLTHPWMVETFIAHTSFMRHGFGRVCRCCSKCQSFGGVGRFGRVGVAAARVMVSAEARQGFLCPLATDRRWTQADEEALRSQQDRVRHIGDRLEALRAARQTSLQKREECERGIVQLREELRTTISKRDEAAKAHRRST